MKQKLQIMALLCCGVLVLSACAGGEFPAEGGELPPAPSEEEPNAPEPEPEEDNRVTYPEDGLPKNSPEDQAYVDAYMNPFAVTGLFRCSFSPDDYSELLESGMMSKFNAFYIHDYPDSTELTLSDEVTEVPGDILEGTLTAHLDLTPEQIRESCASFYDAEAHVYASAFGLGGGPGEYVITQSSLEDGILTLSYDFYGGDYETAFEGFQWLLYEHGRLVMEIDGDNYKYISNTLQPGPGMEE